MKRFLPEIYRNPTIPVSMVAIFAYGFAGAATSPYQSVIGIRELGLGNGTYSLLFIAAATVNVIASIMLGNLADRIGHYRPMMLLSAAFGVLGFGLVYMVPTQAVFVFALLLPLPVYGALNGLLFANIRGATHGMARKELAAVNSGVRAMLSLSWVLVPGIVGALLIHASSMLPAWLVAACACLACLLLIYRFMPDRTGTDRAEARHLTHLAALGEVLSPAVFFRVTAIALICSTLQMNGTVLPLIMTGAAHGTVADVGKIVGIVAALEVVFIVVWGRIQRRISPVAALAIGTGLYLVYLVALGHASAPWHIYALTPVSGFAAAVIITIPITYLQDLIADRPGLGSSLISVNMFMSAGFNALVFALGTGFSDYSGTALLAAASAAVGLAMLVCFERRKVFG
nr:MFS transporter [uncultured Gellertiella sp.]